MERRDGVGEMVSIYLSYGYYKSLQSSGRLERFLAYPHLMLA